MTVISSFSVCISFISFSHLTVTAMNSNTVLNKSGKNEHPCPIPDLRENSFSFSPLSIVLVIDLSYVGFIMLNYAPSIPLSKDFLS